MKSKICYILLLVFCSISARSQYGNNPMMKDFAERKFGMFIHWGPTTLRGMDISWSRGTSVDKQDYDTLYKEFNPVLFNADDIVRTAREAGMKYLVITARHHDGFCLWPTKFTDYNISNTPYKKDIVGALAKACKKQGIKFCIYYSILDWYHPDYPYHQAVSREWSEGFVHPKQPDPKSDMDRYRTYMKNQLKELITQYDPYLLWFDGEWGTPWTREMGKDLYDYIKQVKPEVIINGRIAKRTPGPDGKVVGDYLVYELQVNKLNVEVPWESCFNLCSDKNWSWSPNSPMKSLAQCLSLLSGTIGGNGNLLLNISPMMDGRIEARQVTRLKEIGNWLEINGKAIYNTFGGPYPPTKNYSTTRKGNNIYLQVLNTGVNEISLKNISGRTVKKAYTLTGNQQLTVKKNVDTFSLSLPQNQVGTSQYVIVLELDGDAESIPVMN